MRILLINNNHKNHGGIEQEVIKKMSLLKENGHYVIPYFKENKEIEKFNIWQKILFPFNIFFSLETYKDILKLVDEEKPDIADVNNIFQLISPSVYFALKKKKVPIVQTLYNYRPICVNSFFLDNYGRLCDRCKKHNLINTVKAIINRCYRNSLLLTFILGFSFYIHRKLGTFSKKIDIYISPSEFLKRKFVEWGLKEDKIMVINSSINVENISPHYNFEKYCVFLGRLSKEKGVFILLNAFQTIPDLKLKIIGEGPLSHELKWFVKKKKMANVEFLGFIDVKNKFNILKKAMFIVFPSICFENFPITILESFAVGTPVIASRIGGITEQIEDGKNGLLFESGNFYDLREKILYLKENNREISRMAYRARESVEKKYSYKIEYHKIFHIYKKIIASVQSSSQF